MHATLCAYLYMYITNSTDSVICRIHCKFPIGKFIRPSSYKLTETKAWYWSLLKAFLCIVMTTVFWIHSLICIRGCWQILNLITCVHPGSWPLRTTKTKFNVALMAPITIYCIMVNFQGRFRKYFDCRKNSQYSRNMRSLTSR